jgi:hypothetical protein
MMSFSLRDLIILSFFCGYVILGKMFHDSLWQIFRILIITGTVYIVVSNVLNNFFVCCSYYISTLSYLVIAPWPFGFFHHTWYFRVLLIITIPIKWIKVFLQLNKVLISTVIIWLLLPPSIIFWRGTFV